MRLILEKAIEKYGEGGRAGEMIKGTFELDNEGLDDFTTSSGMISFIQALKLLKSVKIGQPVHELNIEMTLKNCVSLFTKTR